MEQTQTWAVREDDSLKQSVFRSCLRVVIAAMKHHGQRNLGRKGFVQLMSPPHSSSSKETRIEIPARQDPGGKS